MPLRRTLCGWSKNDRVRLRFANVPSSVEKLSSEFEMSDVGEIRSMDWDQV